MNQIHPILETMMHSRGITDIDRFVNPVYEDIADPYTINDMSIAVDRIMQSVDAGERITIYADYDADGIPGAVVLSEFFESIGHTAYDVYLPHRHDEGYGIHIEALDEIAKRGTTLLITIDVGCGARSEVAYAQSLGIEVIVTDHHEIPDGQAPECIFVHPKVGNYADPMLCGCAVAFQLVRACMMRLREIDSERIRSIPVGYEKWMLDMVGLSTLADMVPLVKENRIFAWYGLRVMQKSKRHGFLSLCEAARILPIEMNERLLTFRVVPRINAASRMAHPEVAYKALSAQTREIADEYITELTALNTARMKVVESHMKPVPEWVGTQGGRAILWVGDDAWHTGVLSIIAGKIAEQYKKPIFVWSGYTDDLVKGSVRSHGGVNMLEIMMNAPSEYFTRRGGHAFAGGFTLKKEYMQAMNEYLDQVNIADFTASEYTADDVDRFDADVQCRDVDMLIARDLELLRPWGVGNVQPVFRLCNITLKERKVFGKTGTHEKLFVRDRTGDIAQIVLFSGEKSVYENWQIGEERDLYCHIEVSGTGRWAEAVLRPLGK
jgi:single-stranded-DNA-specific exonuclease